MNLDHAITAACGIAGIHRHQWTADNHGPRVVQARRVLANAMHDEGVTEVEIAKMLGYKSQSNVSHLIASRYRLTEIDIDIVRRAL